jgi:hypothetical protein
MIRRGTKIAGAHGPLNDEAKSLSHVKDDPPAKRDISPRGTKRFYESRDSWWPQSFYQVLSFRHYKNRIPPMASAIFVPNGLIPIGCRLAT